MTEWISTKEKMPEDMSVDDGVDVLVAIPYMDTCVYTVAYRSKGHWFFNSKRTEDDGVPMAWYLFPKLFEEQTKVTRMVKGEEQG